MSAPLCLAVLFDWYLILHVIVLPLEQNKMNERIKVTGVNYYIGEIRPEASYCTTSGNKHRTLGLCSPNYCLFTPLDVVFSRLLDSYKEVVHRVRPT